MPNPFDENSIKNVLPSSRPQTIKGSVRGPGGMWCPIYCANCGADGGIVPEENQNFAFYLCPTCYETHGHIAGSYVEPDVVFWERVKQEQLEKYQRILTVEELNQVADEGTTPLAKLIKEGVK